jgi:hypothetical protein
VMVRFDDITTIVTRILAQIKRLYRRYIQAESSVFKMVESGAPADSDVSCLPLLHKD